MNPGIAMPEGMGEIDVIGMLALPGFEPKQAKDSKNLSGNAESLIGNVLATLDTFVIQAIECRTEAEFIATRERVFPHYFDAVLGLSYLVRVVVPKHVIEAMSDDSYSNIELDFRLRGLEAFGAEVRDQAIFTAWTLRKINNLCKQIDYAPLTSELKQSDSDLFRAFLYHAMCTRFSLDCLYKSMIGRKPIYPEVLPVLLDGLRNAVNTYAYVRRAFDLRNPASRREIIHSEWDEEDQQLLDEATYDLMELSV